MRLKHPDMRPTGSPVGFRFDGREIEALEGETIAALAASDVVAVRQARSGRAARAVLRHGRLLRLPGDGRRPAEPARLPDRKVGRHGRAFVARGLGLGRRARAAGRGDRLRCPGGGRRTGRPVGGARPGAGRRRGGRARRAALPGRTVLRRWRPRTRPRSRPSTASSATVPCSCNPRSGLARASSTRPRCGRRSPHEVAALVAGQSTLYRPKRLVLATGAYEQSPTIPGWTLARVMTVGGLQTLARSYRGAGRAHRDRRQRPALPADRRAPGRRRRRRPCSRRSAPGLGAMAAGKRHHGRSLPDDRRPVARRASRRQAALEPPGDTTRSATIACAASRPATFASMPTSWR